MKIKNQSSFPSKYRLFILIAGCVILLGIGSVVDSSGLVTPLGNGTAVITATLGSDPSVYVKCVVYVQIQEEHDWEFLPTGMTTAL